VANGSSDDKGRTASPTWESMRSHTYLGAQWLLRLLRNSQYGYLVLPTSQREGSYKAFLKKGANELISAVVAVRCLAFDCSYFWAVRFDCTARLMRLDGHKSEPASPAEVASRAMVGQASCLRGQWHRAPRTTARVSTLLRALLSLFSSSPQTTRDASPGLLDLTALPISTSPSNRPLSSRSYRF